MTTDNPFLDKDNEELTSFLTDDVFKRKDINIVTLSGDASTRRYFRVTSEDKAFRHSVVMISGKKNYQDIHSHIETYNFFKKIGFHVPEIYEAAPNKGYIIEEDLGDNSLEFFMNSGSDSGLHPDYYAMAVNMIIRLQNSFDDPDIVHAFSHSLPLRNRFTERKFFQELQMFYDYFFIRYLKMDIAEKEEIENTFYRISEELLDQPLVPTHRDYHSRNLFIKDEKLYVVDFQDARLGPAHYDLVSLVYDPYVHLASPKRKELIEEYRKGVFLKKSSSYMKGFDRLCALCAVQRLLKAIGTYTYMYLDRHNSFYLQFITNALNDISVLIKNSSEFDVLKDHIETASEKYLKHRYL
jgi:N-acetylmuramate 1-kinase